MTLPRYWDTTVAFDRRVTVGRRALWIGRYSGEGVAVGDAIPDLDVTDIATGVRAGWHPNSGLYGFVSLPSETQREVLIVDRTGQYMPRTASIEMPDRSAYARALAAATPMAAAAPSAVSLTMRPSTAWKAGPADTILHGDVTLADGSPAVFAWVDVEAATGHFSTVTDLVGGYLLRISGETPPDAEVFPLPSPPSYTVRVRLLNADVPLDDPYSVWPVDLDSFASTPALLTAAYGADVYSSPVVVAPCARTKWMITL